MRNLKIWASSAFAILSMFSICASFSSCERMSYWTNIDGKQEEADQKVITFDNDWKQSDELFITTQQNIDTLQFFIDFLNTEELRKGKKYLSISSHIWPVCQLWIETDSNSIPFIRAIPFQNKGYAVLPAHQKIQDHTDNILFYTDEFDVDEGLIRCKMKQVYNNLIDSFPEESENLSIDFQLQMLSILSDSMNWNVDIKL